MLDDYYVAHGWDIATGWQLKECLLKLGLNHVKERLEKAGKLPPQKILKKQNKGGK